MRGLGGAKGGLVDTGKACHYGMFHTDFQVAASLTACMAQGEENVAWWYLDSIRVSLERRRSPGQLERLLGVKQVVTSSSASGMTVANATGTTVTSRSASGMVGL